MASAATSVTREEVVVIGGGAVGVCCAYALAREGRSVLLLEAAQLCAGSSWGNSGLLTTSACAPEAAPGVMGQAARWMLDRDGPFRLRPRLDPGFLRWLWHFRAHCTAEAALRGTLFLRDRVRENIRLVETLAGASAHDFAFRTKGLMVLFTTEEGMAEGVAGAAALRELEIPSEELDARAVSEREPAVTDAVGGGILYPEDAHLDPAEFVAAVADLARSHGARIEEGKPVVRLHGSHRVEAVETADGLIEPELVVLANGAWARRLARSTGLTLLVEPGKGFSLTYRAGSEVFGRPLRLWEVRTVVSSMAANVRVTSKLDLVGLDTRVRDRRARMSATRAARYISLPPGVERARVWAGLRPLTPDGLPLIGRSPAVGNLILATGHGHLGVSLGAVTGEAVASIAAGDGPAFDPEPVRPDRFDA
ncbi:MAG TPA: FAD-dependent oxidoreductase [Acidimicrobiia bacterium]|nr:FAD-dependent oxidoreductase [Acidimicrobiia bacterium]